MAKIYTPSAGECEIFDDIHFMTEAKTMSFSLEDIHYEVDLSERTCRDYETTCDRSSK